MQEPIYFDACAMLGRHVHMTPGQAETADQLLAAMDHFGIHEALVLDPISIGTNPMAGNERILRTTAGQPRLHPAWTALLTHSRELPPPDEFVARMRESGVGALFLYYRHYRLPLAPWAVDDLLAELQDSRVPLFLCPNDLVEPGHPDVTDWPGVVRICRDFPELPVIVTESRIYRTQRPLYEALAACPNLKIELSTLWVRNRVEFISREFGPGRIVFGSQLPTRTPGSPLMQLNYSDVPEDEIARIAGGTLRELVSWNPNVKLVEPGQVTFPPAADPLHDKVRSRQSFRDERFHDCHGHIGWSSPYHVINDNPAGIVAEMDRFGLDVCTVFAMQILADNTFGNDEVLEVVNQYPNRFLPFTFVNPHQGEELILRELERGLTLGMQGIKLIGAYLGYHPDGPMIDVAARFAHQHHQIILNHDWGSPERILGLCREYPQATFVQGHSTFAYADVCRQVPNLFICTCPFLAWNQTEDAVAAYGAERILFGSDLTDLPIAWGMGQVLYARISEADKRKIMGENYLALMRKHNVYPRPT